MKKIYYPLFLVFTVLCFFSCATGRPLLVSDLDEVGWGNTSSFQFYLSSALTLNKLPEAGEVRFDNEGEARILYARGSITLPTSLMGRVVKYSERDLFLNVAFEDGDSTLPFAKDPDGKFKLQTTVDNKYQNGVEFVEYEGARYELGGRTKPYLNVVINRSQSDIRRQMQGSQVRAQSSTQEAADRASEKFINELPEKASIAVLPIASGSVAKDREDAALIRDTLEYRLTDAKKFTVVTRDHLDAIFSEQNFQASGYVDDKEAADLGRLSGAGIVITGDISGSGTNRRLNLKALDVQTGVSKVAALEPL